MLRLNVAQDTFVSGRWIVHLYADEGDEHIYQMFAGSAVIAARRALDAYVESLTAAEAIRKFTGEVTLTSDKAKLGFEPEYPTFSYTAFSVDG